MTETTKQFYVLRLWYKPGSSMQGLIENRQGHAAAVIIAALFGGVQSLRVLFGAEGVSPLVVVAGILAGIAGLYLFAWLLRNFSRWFGAQPELAAVRTAVGISLLPWALLFLTLLLLMRGAEDAQALAGIFPVFFAVFVYGFVILLLSVKAVLQLTALKTFLCLIIAVLVSIFPLTLLAQLILGMVAA